MDEELRLKVTNIKFKQKMYLFQVVELMRHHGEGDGWKSIFSIKLYLYAASKSISMKLYTLLFTIEPLFLQKTTTPRSCHEILQMEDRI